MSSLKGALDKFYAKIPGSYWGIISGIFGLLVFLVATVLHSITEPLSFFTHWVSHLGWGPNGSEPVFKIGLIILILLFIPYIIFLTRLLWANRGEDIAKIRNVLTTFGLICSVATAIALVFVSLFGNIGQREFLLHLIGATVYFFVVMGLISFYTASMILDNKASKSQLIITLINMILLNALILSSIPFLVNYVNPAFTYTFQTMTTTERIAFLESAIPQTVWLTFFEWIYVISTLTWFIVTGIHTTKIERKN